MSIEDTHDAPTPTPEAPSASVSAPFVQNLSSTQDAQRATNMEQTDETRTYAPPKNTILLHACCGPCSLEPIRILQEQGLQPVIFYSNSNIAPQEEYQHRLNTLLTWANENDIPVIEDTYDAQDWNATVAQAWDKTERAERCRLCYRQRFTAAARYAAQNGYALLGTTLSVSPYQHTDIIEEELTKAAEKYGVQARFQDYRPYYDNATTKSRELGMYRQNYCGCALSNAEAQAERAERKEQRRAEKAAKREAYAAAHADEIAAREKAAQQNRAEKKAYAEKQTRKKELLREFKKSAR